MRTRAKNFASPPPLMFYGDELELSFCTVRIGGGSELPGRFQTGSRCDESTESEQWQCVPSIDGVARRYYLDDQKVSGVFGRWSAMHQLEGGSHDSRPLRAFAGHATLLLPLSLNTADQNQESLWGPPASDDDVAPIYSGRKERAALSHPPPPAQPPTPSSDFDFQHDDRRRPYGPAR